MDYLQDIKLKPEEEEPLSLLSGGSFLMDDSELSYFDFSGVEPGNYSYQDNTLFTTPHSRKSEVPSDPTSRPSSPDSLDTQVEPPPIGGTTVNGPLGRSTVVQDRPATPESLPDTTPSDGVARPSSPDSMDTQCQPPPIGLSGTWTNPVADIQNPPTPESIPDSRSLEDDEALQELQRALYETSEPDPARPDCVGDQKLIVKDVMPEKEKGTESGTLSNGGPKPFNPGSCILVQEVNSNKYYYMDSSGDICTPPDDSPSPGCSGEPSRIQAIGSAFDNLFQKATISSADGKVGMANVLPSSRTAPQSKLTDDQIQEIGSAFDALFKSTVGYLPWGESNKKSKNAKPKTKVPTTFSKSNYPLEEFNVRAQKKPSKDNQNNNQNDQTVKAIEPRKKQPKKKMSCPHCPILDRNVDANMLRLHIFTHYKEFWEGKIDCRLRKFSDKEELVRKCTLCNRAISGGSSEGLRQAALCHFAIQHLELRQALENDKSLREGFVTELFQDIDSKKSGRSFYESLTKAVKTCHPGQKRVGSCTKVATRARSELPKELKPIERPMKRSATALVTAPLSSPAKRKKPDPTKAAVEEAKALDLESDYVNRRAAMFKISSKTK